MSSIPAVRTRTDLDGTWRYVKDPESALTFEEAAQRLQADDADEMTVPTNWWFEIGEFFGVIWFGREFTYDPAATSDSAFLRFEGVDYIADVWVNEVYVGRHEGMFAPFEFEVAAHLEAGQRNRITVRVDSPWDDTEVFLVEHPGYRSIEKEPYKRHWPKEVSLVKGGMIDQMHKPGAFTSFFQDGNTGGIWNSVSLVESGNVTIAGTKIYCKVTEEAREPEGMVAIDLTLTNHTDATVTVDANVQITADNFSLPADIPAKQRRLTVPPGTHTFKVVHTIADPQRWYTWDRGPQNLYRIAIGVARDGAVVDSTQVVTGFKDIVVDQETKQFFVNGERLFIRGARYHGAYWQSEAPERYEGDLQAIKDANHNSIRIGSHVERPEFYEMCDRMGFLVWQVFPLHYCVSDSDDFIERASDQMVEMVAGLYNHVSIGVWSVFKEPEVYGDPETMPNNYNRLCRILKETAESIDSTRWVHQGDYRENVQNVMVGCLRPMDTDMKRTHLEPLIVEYGAGTLQPLESLRKMLPEEAIWPPDWDEWARIGWYPAHLDTMGVPVGDSIEEFIEECQLAQERNTKEILEYFRQRKYTPVAGYYHYYWRDYYPGIGTGVVDYYGEVLPAAHAMGAANTPVLISVEWIKERHEVGTRKFWHAGSTFDSRIWVTNDHLDDLEGCRVTVRLVGPDGQVVDEHEEPGVSVPADSSVVVYPWIRTLPATTGDHRLEVALTAADGQDISSNHFAFEVV